jgi:hypothetical protein
LASKINPNQPASAALAGHPIRISQEIKIPIMPFTHLQRQALGTPTRTNNASPFQSSSFRSVHRTGEIRKAPGHEIKTRLLAVVNTSEDHSHSADQTLKEELIPSGKKLGENRRKKRRKKNESKRRSVTTLYNVHWKRRKKVNRRAAPAIRAPRFFVKDIR